jgi:hypothetical protein
MEFCTYTERAKQEKEKETGGESAADLTLVTLQCMVPDSRMISLALCWFLLFLTFLTFDPLLLFSFTFERRPSGNVKCHIPRNEVAT